MAKVQISIDDKLLERVDNYADANCMSRSGLVSISLLNYLNTNEAFTAVRNVNLAFKKIAESGSIDHESMEKLEQFQMAINVLFPDK